MNRLTTFADWLRDTREAQGYSKNALAKAAGINRSHIYKMEGGDITEPADDTRQKLHAAFGTSDDDLVTLGIMVRREYQRAGATVVQYEYVPRALLPPEMVPAPASGDAVLDLLLSYWGGLGDSQRAHLVETARMFAEAAATRARTPAASSRSTEAPSGTAPDRGR